MSEEPFRNYRELRALAEELVRARQGEQRSALQIALEQWLGLHCRSCGELLEREQRVRGDEYCYACVDEAPLKPTRDDQ